MEEWRTINRYGGFYDVSNKGRIRSRRRSGKPRILKTHVINSGYEVIPISYKGKKYNELVHRVVAEYFVEEYAEHLDVNHKDANRLNNTAENLEWVTRKENIHDMIKRGAHSVSEAHAVAHKKRRRPVIQLTKDGDELARFESARAAANHIGIHENCVSRVCRGERPYAGGFRWQYIKDGEIV